MAKRLRIKKEPLVFTAEEMTALSQWAYQQGKENCVIQSIFDKATAHMKGKRNPKPKGRK